MSVLFKKDARGGAKLLSGVFALLCMYCTLIIMMFDPSIGKVLDQFAKTMPQIMSMFGMGSSTATLTDFIANYLYGFLMLLVPLLFTISTAGRLFSRRIDRGSMACLLSVPLGRRAIALTGAAVLAGGLTLLVLLCTVLQLIVSALCFPGALAVGPFLLMNLGVLSLHLALAGLCYFLSLLCDDTRRYYLLGAGIPLVFYLLQMLANMGDKLSFFKYFTLFSLFQPAKFIAEEPSALISAGILFALAAVLFTSGTILFEKRDLSV